MPDYRRARLAGGCYFFTVNCLERRMDYLTRYIDLLRHAVRSVRLRHPFHIDAWMVLPDHLHCVWTLPEGDAEYSKRWYRVRCAVRTRTGGPFELRRAEPVGRRAAWRNGPRCEMVSGLKKAATPAFGEPPCGLPPCGITGLNDRRRDDGARGRFR